MRRRRRRSVLPRLRARGAAQVLASIRLDYPSGSASISHMSRAGSQSRAPHSPDEPESRPPNRSATGRADLDARRCEARRPQPGVLCGTRGPPMAILFLGTSFNPSAHTSVGRPGRNAARQRRSPVKPGRSLRLRAAPLHSAIRMLSE